MRIQQVATNPLPEVLPLFGGPGGARQDTPDADAIRRPRRAGLRPEQVGGGLTLAMVQQGVGGVDAHPAGIGTRFAFQQVDKPLALSADGFLGGAARDHRQAARDGKHDPGHHFG